MKKLKKYWLNYCSVGDILTLKIAYRFQHGYWDLFDESQWLVKSIGEFEIKCSKVGFTFEGLKIEQKAIDDGYIIIKDKK